MSLRKSLDKLKFDKRLVSQNIRRGEVSEQDYKNHRENLTDLAGKAEALAIDTSDMVGSRRGTNPSDFN